jgi:alanyl-tRNA synthetase
MEGFEQKMAIQRTLSRDTGQFTMDLSQVATTFDCQSIFTGYEQTQGNSKVIALFHEGNPVDILNTGQNGRVILEQTPFYAESGGQVGDKGVLTHDSTTFTVTDTQKLGKAHLHLGTLTTGTLRIGDSLLARIDTEARKATARHHSATHLLHAALRTVLGEHVKQKGSLVSSERLRFDFSHFEAITSEQLLKIEQLVNQQILLNTPVQTRLMALAEAMNSGAMALFGEKYDEQVRVLSIGDFSTELCGGTHVQRAGDIGLFKIIAESGIAAGVRRIEAVTGEQALVWVTSADRILAQLSSALKTSQDSLIERFNQLLEQNRAYEKELVKLQTKLASHQGSDLATQADEIKGIKVLAARLENVDVKQLRTTLDQLKNKLGTAVIALATVKEEKITLVTGVTSDVTDRLQAGELANYVAQQVGGKGGGKAEMAQAGGNNPANLAEALASVSRWVYDRVS